MLFPHLATLFCLIVAKPTAGSPLRSESMASCDSQSVDLLPLGSWDTHLHTFNPAKHPYEADAPYFPPESTVAQALERLPVDNFVFVMAMPEGTRPANVLESVASVNKVLTNDGRHRQARATVVLDFDNTTDAKLAELHKQGVRSVRIHNQGAITKGLTGDDALADYIETVARRIAPLGWTLDGQLPTAKWIKFTPLLKRLNREVGIEFVADHHFYLKPVDYKTKNYTAIIELIESGIVYTKISGLTQRVLEPGQNPDDMAPVSKGLASAAYGNRAIYGSDWPHVVASGGGSETKDIDEKAELVLYRKWFGEELFRKMMVDNPAKLYK